MPQDDTWERNLAAAEEPRGASAGIIAAGSYRDINLELSSINIEPQVCGCSLIVQTIG